MTDDTHAHWLASPYGRIATAPLKPSGKPVRLFKPRKRRTDATNDDDPPRLTLQSDGMRALLSTVADGYDVRIDSDSLVALINARLVTRNRRHRNELTDTGRDLLDHLNPA
jgi:hypothetical protein